MGMLFECSCLHLSMYLKTTFLLLSCLIVLLEARHSGSGSGSWSGSGSGSGSGGGSGSGENDFLDFFSSICSAACQGLSCTGDSCIIASFNLGSCQIYNPTGCVATTTFPPRSNK